MIGWVKLHRKIQSSAMYRALNSIQRDVMIQCLLMANHSHKEWYWGNEMYVCEPGQFITSLESIRLKCAKGTSIKNVRTSLVKLEKMFFLANKSTKTGRLITIINWDTYQGEGSDTGNDIGKDVANERQRCGKDVATNKNVKNEENAKNEEEVKTVADLGKSDTEIVKVPKEKKKKGRGVPVWNAYSEAYLKRYGVEPVRNAKSNAICAQLVDRLGAEEAPHVAAFYLTSGNQYHVGRGHSLNIFLDDAEKVRTEWATGNRITQSKAQEADRLSEQGSIWKRVKEKQGDQDGPKIN